MKVRLCTSFSLSWERRKKGGGGGGTFFSLIRFPGRHTAGLNTIGDVRKIVSKVQVSAKSYVSLLLSVCL